MLRLQIVYFFHNYRFFNKSQLTFYPRTINKLLSVINHQLMTNTKWTSKFPIRLHNPLRCSQDTFCYQNYRHIPVVNYNLFDSTTHIQPL